MPAAWSLLCSMQHSAINCNASVFTCNNEQMLTQSLKSGRFCPSLSLHQVSRLSLTRISCCTCTRYPQLSLHQVITLALAPTLHYTCARYSTPSCTCTRTSCLRLIQISCLYKHHIFPTVPGLLLPPVRAAVSYACACTRYAGRYTCIRQLRLCLHQMISPRTALDTPNSTWPPTPS